jgi:GNAT superfamily N-acetyltransferase
VATIRTATDADLERLVEMAQRFRALVPFGDGIAPTTDLQLAIFITFILEHGTAFVAEVELPAVGRALVGMIGILGPIVHPFSGVVFGEEPAWWVEPEYRGTSIGAQLLTAAEDWARQQGILVLRMGAPTTSGIGRFYDRMGYHAVNVEYQKTLA